MPRMYRLRKKKLLFIFTYFLATSINSVTLHFQRNSVSEGFHSQFRFMAAAVLDCFVLHKIWALELKKITTEIEKISLDKAREALCSPNVPLTLQGFVLWWSPTIFSSFLFSKPTQSEVVLWVWGLWVCSRGTKEFPGTLTAHGVGTQSSIVRHWLEDCLRFYISYSFLGSLQQVSLTNW